MTRPAAGSDWYDLGRTKSGTKIHLIDFDSDSALVRGASKGDDRTACGHIGHYSPLDGKPPSDAGFYCYPCFRTAYARDHIDTAAPFDADKLRDASRERHKSDRYEGDD